MGGGAVEIITKRERRQRWSVADKLRILAECDAPGIQAAEVTARYGVSRSLVFQWRHQARNSLHVWLAPGATDMRRRFDELALVKDPFSGQLFMFRRRHGGLVKAQ